MSLAIGIVGLPNVGKSTLFQTLTKKKVDIANYPFCTIDPNIGVVAVPDERVDKLAELTHSAKKIYATIEFVDIAGLVKGASKGEGLGNKFLANIRETDAIIYVLRAFLNPDIVNTQNNINPVAQKEILDLELILKDLETIHNRLISVAKEAKSGKKEALSEMVVLEKAKKILSEEKILSEQTWSDDEFFILRQYQLLTLKPRLYLLNGSEQEIQSEVLENFKKNNWPYVFFDVLNEFESASFSREERLALNLSADSGLDLLIKKSYELLGLITFLTTGPDETRAWEIIKGWKAPQAAGVIHTDFEKYFIRAEVINWQKLLACGGFVQAKEKGTIRSEGKDYLVQDGDVMEIKHGAA